MAPVAHNLTAGSTGTLSREEASRAVWMITKGFLEEVALTLKYEELTGLTRR